MNNYIDGSSMIQINQNIDTIWIERESVQCLLDQFDELINSGAITSEHCAQLLGNLVDLDKEEPESALEVLIFNFIDNITLSELYNEKVV